MQNMNTNAGCLKMRASTLWYALLESCLEFANLADDLVGAQGTTVGRASDWCVSDQQKRILDGPLLACHTIVIRIHRQLT